MSSRLASLLLPLALTITVPLVPVTQACAASFSIGAQEASNFSEAQVIDSPRPEIPTELCEQGIKSCCVARFQIQDTGKCSVKIVTSSGSQEIDDIARETLQRWRFKPATVDGKPIASSRKIRVEFEYD